jgi:hypothetical protein
MVLWYIGEIGSEAKVGIILRGLKKKKKRMSKNIGIARRKSRHENKTLITFSK